MPDACLVGEIVERMNNKLILYTLYSDQAVKTLAGSTRW